MTVSELEFHLPDIQAQLKASSIDGWLVYDFHDRVPHARKLAGLEGAHLTRRWFLWLPAEGEPALLVGRLEVGSLPEFSYPVRSYAERESLLRELRALLGGATRIAMDYSPQGNIPYVSYVDGGTLESVRALGVEVASSGDVLQLLSRWTGGQVAAHRRAATVLERAKEDALELMRRSRNSGRALSEYEVQRHLVRDIEAAGMSYDHPPIVAFGANAADAHYVPQAERSSTLKKGDAVLMDLWCKEQDGPYADITWMAHAGEPGPDFSRAFAAVLEARDAAVSLMRVRLEAGRRVEGWEVDEAAKTVLRREGYQQALVARTGHSLGLRHVHGSAVHLDNFETKDERALVPGIAVTVEPHLSLESFGVRSEIDVLVTENGLDITTRVQTSIDLV